MASKKTLNAKNLEALGAERLAQLLIEISTGSAAAKRRLRLELAGALGPAEVARDIRKRLSTIARSRSHIAWDKTKALVQDLEMQRSGIVEKVAPTDPHEALDLMWRFLGLAEPIYMRCNDSDGSIGYMFRGALADMKQIAEAARPEANLLADRVFTALQENGHGRFNDLIPQLAPVLGPGGLAHLKSRVLELAEQDAPVPLEDEPMVAGRGGTGKSYADELAARARRTVVRFALMDIADATGDVDSFIGQCDAQKQKVPDVAAAIAERLLAAGRAEDAWGFLERAEVRDLEWGAADWERVRLDVLEAFGRGEEAQAFRLDCFKRRLDPEHLRAYIKRLPDFDDIEAEDKALAYASAYPDVLRALDFLLLWPALDRAAHLVTKRTGELDGKFYEILAPAAEDLAEKYPLAATLALRAMIDFALNTQRSKRYGHAARHLLECARLAGGIEDFGDFEPHAAYLANLKARHGRSYSFWQHVA